MAGNELAPDRLCDLIDVEGTSFSCHRCVEDHLEQQISEFLLDLSVCTEVGVTTWRLSGQSTDRINRLVGLFEEVGDKCVVGLFLVPRALVPQDPVDIDEAVKATRCLWHKDRCPRACVVPGKLRHRHQLDDLIRATKAVENSDGRVRSNGSHQGQPDITGSEA